MSNDTKKTEKQALEKVCKNCWFWKNHQERLNYHEEIGVCICPAFQFNTHLGRLVGIVDKQNPKDRAHVSGNPAHDFETKKEGMFDVIPSRYLLQTHESFGCNQFEYFKSESPA